MFQLQCNGGIVTGRDGVCYPYGPHGRPMIPVLVKGDLSGIWTKTDMLLDTGADITVLHSDVASTVGLDIEKYDEVGVVIGIDGCERPLFYKKGVLIKIANFPAIPITIGFSTYLRQGLRLLGRKTILSLFGIAFNSKEIGIFIK